jgi:hypothetical protein
MSGTVPVRAWDIYRIMNPDAPLLKKAVRRIYSNFSGNDAGAIAYSRGGPSHKVRPAWFELLDFGFVFLFAPFLRCFSFEMAVSMALPKRVGCPNAILSIKPSSTKEEVVLVEDVVILALTVDITFIKLKSNRCRLRR